MVPEGSAAAEDWRTVVTNPVYKCKGERPQCKNYRDITFLSAVGKICAEVLVY